jgi:hypothetical protein
MNYASRPDLLPYHYSECYEYREPVVSIEHDYDKGRLAVRLTPIWEQDSDEINPVSLHIEGGRENAGGWTVWYSDTLDLSRVNHSP